MENSELNRFVFLKLFDSNFEIAKLFFNEKKLDSHERDWDLSWISTEVVTIKIIIIKMNIKILA